MVIRSGRSIGDRVDGWTLRSFLGEGGNAAVWEAERDGDVAALKILNRKQPTSEPYQRFREEIAVLRQLGPYPGVLQLIDSSLPDQPSTDSPAWIAFPIATPIRAALGPNPPAGQVVDAIASIADTLACLTEDHGIYHRDIKPENLYRYGEQWCVGDFGLVDHPNKPPLTAEGRWVGPIHYLAPELTQQPETADPELADVFSLAKTLWVSLTGQNYPLPGWLSRQIPQFRLSTYVAHERSYMLDALVERSTHPEPTERPRMREFANELSAWRAVPSKMAVPSLDEVAGRAFPTLQEHQRVAKLRGDLRRHVETFIRDYLEQVRPIAEAAQRSLSLVASVSTHTMMTNCREIQSDESWARKHHWGDVGFNLNSPTPVGAGNNPIVLGGGLLMIASPDGDVKLHAAYYLYLGPNQYETLWHGSRTARHESALEAQHLSQLVSGLANQLPEAISAFVRELSARKP